MSPQEHRGEGWFTPRENDILRLIVEARTNPEIAKQLGIGEGAVKSYVKRLCAKLHARNRVDVAVKAIRLKLVDVSGLPDPTPRGMFRLSKREEEVLELLMQRLLARTVAEQLGLTIRTVLQMESDIRRKWGVASREALIGIASTWSGWEHVRTPRNVPTPSRASEERDPLPTVTQKPDDDAIPQEPARQAKSPITIRATKDTHTDD